MPNTGLSFPYGFDIVDNGPIDTRRMWATDIATRDLIAAGTRWIGMETWVTSEGKKYRLEGGIENINWVLVNDQSGVGSASYSKELISGGAIWSGTGFQYDVSVLVFRFYGDPITNTPQSAIAVASDPTDPRIDAIVVDIDGNVTVIAGTPAPNPVTPVISEDQLLVQYILIPAGATEPGVTIEQVYLEHTAPPEWVGSTNPFPLTIGTVDFDNTIDPKQGVKCILVSGIDRSGSVTLTRTTSLGISGWATLSFWIKLHIVIPYNASLRVRGLGNSASGPNLDVSAYGLDVNNVSDWQLIVIPTSALGIAGIQTLAFVPVSNVQIGGTPPPPPIFNFSLDDIQLQDGTPPIIGGEGNTEFYVEGTFIAAAARVNYTIGAGPGIVGTYNLLTGIVEIALPPGGSGSSETRNIFTPTSAQTAFTLTAAPSLPALTKVFLNGVQQRYGLDFSISGTTMTWLVYQGIALDSIDRVDVYFS